MGLMGVKYCRRKTSLLRKQNFIIPHFTSIGFHGANFHRIEFIETQSHRVYVSFTFPSECIKRYIVGKSLILCVREQ